MPIDQQQLNSVATHAALIKHQMDLVEEALHNIADHADKLAKAARDSAHELVRP